MIKIEELIKNVEGLNLIRPIQTNITTSYEITTSFLDIHNDHIVLHYKETTEGVWINDNGYTINDLKLIELNLESNTIKKLFEGILRRYNINLHKDMLFKSTTYQSLPQDINTFIQAILDINMLYTVSMKYERILKEKNEINEELIRRLKEIVDNEKYDN